MQNSKSIDKNGSETQFNGGQENYGETRNFERKSEKSTKQKFRHRGETISMTNLLSQDAKSYREMINTANGKLNNAINDYENDAKGKSVSDLEKNLELIFSSSQMPKRKKEKNIDNLCEINQDMLKKYVSNVALKENLFETFVNLESPVVSQSPSCITQQTPIFGNTTYQLQKPDEKSENSENVLQSVISMFNISTTKRPVNEDCLKQKTCDTAIKENEVILQKINSSPHGTHIYHRRNMAHKKKKKHYNQTKLGCHCLLLIGFALVFKRLRKFLLGECKNKSKMDFLNSVHSTKLL